MLTEKCLMILESQDIFRCPLISLVVQASGHASEPSSIPALLAWLQARTLAFRKAHANIDATIRCVEGVLERYEVTGQVRKELFWASAAALGLATMTAARSPFIAARACRLLSPCTPMLRVPGAAS